MEAVNVTRRQADFDWLIVGGGLQGVAMAGALVRSGKATGQSLAILDGGETPLWAWQRRSGNCGMFRMRSDIRYHLDCCPQKMPYTLEQWANNCGFENEIELLDPETNHRVASTKLFEAHCNWFIEERKLKHCWQQGVATELVQTNESWQVRTKGDETVTANKVVVATGQNALNYPEWASQINAVYHLLDPSQQLPLSHWQRYKHITAVGGGLTMLNFLVSLMQSNCPANVTLLLRHPFKVGLLEADLRTLEADFQKLFQKADYAGRRELIKQSRTNGTVPATTLKMLNPYLGGKIEVKQGVVKSAQQISETCQLNLEDGSSLETEVVVLGTGFKGGPCQDKLVTQVASSYNLPLSKCGYPMPGYDLQWLPGLYLLGGLAELELGPVSRNIAGAAQGVQRVIDSVL